MKDLIKFFLVGMLWDGIIALDIVFTSSKSAVGAALTTLVLTILSFKVYSKIVDGGLNWGLLWALALGSAIGTYITIWLM